MSRPMTHPFGDRVCRSCPGLRVGALLHRSAKAVVVAGELDGVDVIAKLLIDTDTFWQTKFAAEIESTRSSKRPHLLCPRRDCSLRTRTPGCSCALDCPERRSAPTGIPKASAPPAPRSCCKQLRP